MQTQALTLRIVIIGASLVLWELAARAGWIDAEVLPSLTVVAATLSRLLQDWSFLTNASITGLRVLAAFLIAVPLAALLGIALSGKARIRHFVGPIVYFVMSVPQSIFLPLFILVFGIGSPQKIIFGVSHALFVMSVSVAAAIRSVPHSYFMAARSFGASRLQIYRLFYLPAMLPILFAGIRLGLIYDVLGVLLAEMYASRDGLGMLIFQWGESLRVKEMLATILLISLITIVLNESLRVPEALFDRWRLSAGRR